MINELSMLLVKEITKNSYEINLKVKAGNKKDEIGPALTFNDTTYLKIAIKQAPEDGKANLAIIKLLAKELGVPQQNIVITSGSRSKFKKLIIKNIALEDLKNNLKHYINNCEIKLKGE